MNYIHLTNETWELLKSRRASKANTSKLVMDATLNRDLTRLTAIYANEREKLRELFSQEELVVIAATVLWRSQLEAVPVDLSRMSAMVSEAIKLKNLGVHMLPDDPDASKLRRKLTNLRMAAKYALLDMIELGVTD